MSEVLKLVLGATLVLALYFISTFVAFARNRSNVRAIFLLNALTGWTVIGWGVALLWANASESALQGEVARPGSGCSGRENVEKRAA